MNILERLEVGGEMPIKSSVLAFEGVAPRAPVGAYLKHLGVPQNEAVDSKTTCWSP